jgi:MtN3 and saliva related transmembrane protein
MSFLQVNYDKMAHPHKTKKTAPSGALQSTQDDEDDSKDMKKARDIYLVGIIAGTITSMAFLPQVIKSIKEHSATHLTWITLCMAILGQSMWFTYGLLSKDNVVRTFAMISLTMYLFLVISKVTFPLKDAKCPPCGVPIPNY